MNDDIRAELRLHRWALALIVALQVATFVKVVFPGETHIEIVPTRTAERAP